MIVRCSIGQQWLPPGDGQDGADVGVAEGVGEAGWWHCCSVEWMETMEEDCMVSRWELPGRIVPKKIGVGMERSRIQHDSVRAVQVTRHGRSAVWGCRHGAAASGGVE
ncbi:unnamed protein product [Ostreobium quekettii]|uniref:Uncharacterized protein n=1 Tax=Ostreobium quekettii TaxID=121088 RepID=A0A8S1IZ55_9CHLO|nr:unnamed protein product [Ostreobium quekettii]|eukprot:evm.model.scf_432.2 EVM.evm.TU.scf_432.2   scf_432:53222-53545(-)